LFEQKLPGCLLTMQRKKNAKGYFHFTRFGKRSGDDVLDEIALNPATFLERTDREIVSTLVHEQVTRHLSARVCGWL
jgi:predicted SprT family Zn-dependent metalloprotease